MKGIDQEIFNQLAREVQEEFKMDGLAGTLYQTFAEEVCKKYLQKIGVFKMRSQLIKSTEYLENGKKSVFALLPESLEIDFKDLSKLIDDNKKALGKDQKKHKK